MRRTCNVAFFAVLLIGGIFWLRRSFNQNTRMSPAVAASSRPIVALLDTGIDMAADSRFAESVMGDAADHIDTSGHGTALAKVVLDECPKCRILPIRVTESGGALRPSDLSAGLRRALDARASVVNISNGIVHEGPTPEDERTFEEAARESVPVVIAAGRGVPNPFRPLELSRLFPQRLKSVVVVGAASADGTLDPQSNFGPELDVAVTAEGGSSFAAARLSAWIAKRGHVRYGNAKVIKSGPSEYRWVSDPQFTSSTPE